MSQRPEPSPIDPDDAARLTEQMTARSSAWPSGAEKPKFTKPVELSPRFAAWAQAHGYVIVPEGRARTLIVAPEHHPNWLVWPTPSANGLWAVGHRYRDGRVTRLFDVADGDDLERVLCYLIGDGARFQRTGVFPIEYPSVWATGWSQAPTTSPDAPAELIDPDGVVRYRAHVPGMWRPRVLSYVLQTSPSRVAKAYDANFRTPWRRMPTRRPSLSRIGSAAIVLALISAVIYVAAHAGDNALTVTLFAVTAPLVVGATAALGAGLVLGAIDENALVRDGALWWVTAGVAGSGLTAELVGMWLAYGADGTTWFYPLIAAAGAFTAAGIVWAIGALVER